MFTYKECFKVLCKKDNYKSIHCGNFNCSEPHCHYRDEGFRCVPFIEDCRDHRLCEDGCHKDGGCACLNP